MHFRGEDQFHGFERRIYGDCGSFLSREIQGKGYNRTNGQTKYAVEVSGYGRTGTQAYDRQVTRTACRFIASRERGGRPYCLVVGYAMPHNPLICSEELFRHYSGALPVPPAVSQDYLQRLNPAIKKWRQRRGVDDLSPQQNHRGLAAYYGLVTELDANLGAVMETVASSGQADDAVLIYCSDHGDMACEHGMWWKSSHYEGSARIPLIISWPRRFGQGRRVEAVTSLIDVGPTVLEIAGADPLPGVTGRSLLPFLDGSTKEWADEVFCEYIGAHGDRPSCMIRRHEWKLMYYSEYDTFLLFNLEEDPEEMRDRAAEARCGTLAEELLERISNRWSADRMLAGKARETAQRTLLESCGHLPIPHRMAHPRRRPGDNVFDFSQVPGWPEIKKRVGF
jgi:choline-sulfatase